MAWYDDYIAQMQLSPPRPGGWDVAPEEEGRAIPTKKKKTPSLEEEGMGYQAEGYTPQLGLTGLQPPQVPTMQAPSRPGGWDVAPGEPGRAVPGISTTPITPTYQAPPVPNFTQTGQPPISSIPSLAKPRWGGLYRPGQTSAKYAREYKMIGPMGGYTMSGEDAMRLKQEGYARDMINQYGADRAANLFGLR